jgi:hypothetical protein
MTIELINSADTPEHAELRLLGQLVLGLPRSY